MKSYSIDTFSSSFLGEALSINDIGLISLVDSTNYGESVPDPETLGNHNQYYIFNDVDPTTNMPSFDSQNRFQFNSDNQIVNFDKIIIYDKSYNEISSMKCSYYYTLSGTKLLLEISVDQTISANYTINAWIVDSKSHSENQLFSSHSNIVNYVDSLYNTLNNYSNVIDNTLSVRQLDENTEPIDTFRESDPKKIYQNSLYNILYKDVKLNRYGLPLENNQYLMDRSLRLFSNIKPHTSSNIFNNDVFIISINEYNLHLQYANYFFTSQSQGIIIPISLKGFILYKYSYNDKEWTIDLIEYPSLNLTDINLKPDYFEYLIKGPYTDIDGNQIEASLDEYGIPVENDVNRRLISFGNKLTLSISGESDSNYDRLLENSYYTRSIEKLFSFDQSVDSLQFPTVNPESVPFFSDSYKNIPVKFYRNTNVEVVNILPNQITSFTSIAYQYTQSFDNKTPDNKLPIDYYSNKQYLNYVYDVINKIIRFCDGTSTNQIKSTSLTDVIVSNMNKSFDSNNIAISATYIGKENYYIKNDTSEIALYLSSKTFDDENTINTVKEITLDYKRFIYPTLEESKLLDTPLIDLNTTKDNQPVYKIILDANSDLIKINYAKYISDLKDEYINVIKYGFKKLFTKDYVKSLVQSYELDKTDVFSIITDTAIKEWCEDNGYWDTELQSPTESYEDIPWNFLDLIINCSEIPFTDEYLKTFTDSFINTNQDIKLIENTDFILSNRYQLIISNNLNNLSDTNLDKCILNIFPKNNANNNKFISNATEYESTSTIYDFIRKTNNKNVSKFSDITEITESFRLDSRYSNNFRSDDSYVDVCLLSIKQTYEDLQYFEKYTELSCTIIDSTYDKFMDNSFDISKESIETWYTFTTNPDNLINQDELIDIHDIVITSSNKVTYVQNHDLYINNDSLFTKKSLNKKFWEITFNKQNNKYAYLNGITKFLPKSKYLRKCISEDFKNENSLDYLYISDYIDSQNNVIRKDLTEDYLSIEVYSVDELRDLIYGSEFDNNEDLYYEQDEHDSTKYTFCISPGYSLRTDSGLDIENSRLNLTTGNTAESSDPMYTTLTVNRTYTIHYLGLDYEYPISNTEYISLKNGTYYYVLTDGQNVQFAKLLNATISSQESYIKSMIAFANETLWTYRNRLDKIQFKLCDEGVLVIDKSYADVDILHYNKIYLLNNSNTRQSNFKYIMPKTIQRYTCDISNGYMYIYYTYNNQSKLKVINLDTNSELTYFGSSEVYLDKYNAGRKLLKDLEL